MYVLDALRAQPRPDVEVTLLSPYPRQVHSGMLPGWIAGHYSLDECVLPLDRLAVDAQVRFVQQKGIGLDLAAKQLQCSDGQTMDFDVISIDTGPVTDTRMVPGAAEHALPIRPIERFISGWQRWLETLGEAGSPAIAIVGGGAAGVELALAMRYRLELDRAARHIPIHLVSSQPEPLAGMPAVLRKAVSRLLAERRIDWLGGRRAIHYNGRTLCLSGGGRVPATHCLLVPGRRRRYGRRPRDWLPILRFHHGPANTAVHQPPLTCSPQATLPPMPIHAQSPASSRCGPVRLWQPT